MYQRLQPYVLGRRGPEWCDPPSVSHYHTQSVTDNHTPSMEDMAAGAVGVRILGYRLCYMYSNHVLYGCMHVCMWLQAPWEC